MKNKKGKNKKEDKARFVNKSKKKQLHKKSRHSDRKAVKDMIDLCKPEEYDEYSDYCWDDD
jgi:hypothetical protein